MLSDDGYKGAMALRSAHVTCAHKDIPTYPCPRIRYGIVPLVRHRDYFPSPQVFSNHTVL